MEEKENALLGEFNSFLEIGPVELETIHRYRHILTRDAERFTTAFYDYLFKFPSTAKFLSAYNKDHSNIDVLIKKQTEHLCLLISSCNDPNYVNRQQEIGQIHYQKGIEPAWVMGAYHLYLKHLLAIIKSSAEIEESAREPLINNLNKLLFRDMGLMLDGYWNAATARTRQEKIKIEKLQRQVSDLLANIPQVIWSIDIINNKILYISPTAEDTSPISMNPPIPYLYRTSNKDRSNIEAAWLRALSGEKAEIESREYGPQKYPRWFKRTFHPFTNEKGEVVRIDGIMEEITEAIITRSRLERLAKTDVLTGLANRAMWYDHINQALAICRREKDRQAAIILLDLNHFKYINDTLGHPAGDIVLRQVAQRLKEVLREGDTLARLGGDEFAILLPHIDNGHTAARMVSEKVQYCFEDPYMFGGNELYLGVAIGIAIYPLNGLDPDTLVKRADMAMYTSKRNNSRFQFYKEGIDKSYNKQIHLVSQIKKALRDNEFELYYQPKINLNGGGSDGVEALIRWIHPQHGMLMPDSFIPIAEQMGLINEITDWVITNALEQSQQWRREGIPISVAINISARSFQNHNFIKHIQDVLHAAKASPECLELEITENTLMSNIDQAVSVIQALSDIGVGVAIDDFGTGYSSLSYLKQLPINQLKIDKSFIKHMNHGNSDAAIVLSIIELGHNLGIKVIAEGVERPESIEILKKLGCDSAQGYHISHPMPKQEVKPWFSYHHHGPIDI